MPVVDSVPVPPALVQRAAAIARGPHACPSCESPTFAEPPVPWTDLRDYVVRCDACDRPVTIRVDRARILRRTSLPRHLRAAAELHDPVGELLDTRGRRAFMLRVLASLVLPILVASIALQAGASVLTALLLVTLSMVPSALWGPAVVAATCGLALDHMRAAHARARARLRMTPRQAATIEVEPGRWDQWMREQRRREREREADPEAVLRELARVLDERELRRVRMLAEHGEVPPDHLDDLLRFRRAWRATA